MAGVKPGQELAVVTTKFIYDVLTVEILGVPVQKTALRRHKLGKPLANQFAGDPRGDRSRSFGRDTEVQLKSCVEAEVDLTRSSYPQRCL